MTALDWHGAAAARLPYRDAIRKHVHGPVDSDGRSGIVVTDIDIHARAYGPKFRVSARGKFMIVEVKGHRGNVPYGQLCSLTQLHELLRRGDPYGYEYVGTFVVQTDGDNWDRVDAFDLTDLGSGTTRRLSPAEWFDFLNFGVPKLDDDTRPR